MSNISSEIERYQKLITDEKLRLNTDIKKLAITTYSQVLAFSPFPEGQFSTGLFKGNNIFSLNGAEFTLYPNIRVPENALADSVNKINSVSVITSFHITNSSDYAQNVENTGWGLTPPYMPYKKAEAFVISQIGEAFKDLEVVRR